MQQRTLLLAVLMLAGDGRLAAEERSSPAEKLLESRLTQLDNQLTQQIDATLATWLNRQIGTTLPVPVRFSGTIADSVCTPFGRDMLVAAD